MAAYIAKTRETADGIQLAETTEGRDAATVRYYIFAAADEAAAIAALREQAPATYNAGGKSMGRETVAIDGWQGFDPAAPGCFIFSGVATYAGGVAGTLGGELTMSAAPTPGVAVGLIYDLVTPAAARSGGTVAWYVGGVYRAATAQAGAQFTPAAGDLGKELRAILSHDDYQGNVAVSQTIGDAETLGGTVAIDGNPPVQTGGDPVTLSAILSGVTPAAARVGGAYQWLQNGAVIGTGASVAVSTPGTVRLDYSHTGYAGTLTAYAGAGGGSGGSGDRKKATISFSAALGTTTRLLVDEAAIVRHWEWDSAARITGLNPGLDGIPQGAEVPDPAFGVRLSRYKRPSEVNLAFMHRLNALNGRVNAAPFLGFAAKTVMIANVERARSGDTSADWWQIDIQLQIKPGKTVTYRRAGGTRTAPQISQGTLSTDSGWQYVNVLYQRLKISGEEVPLCVAAQVVDLPLTADFSWLEAEAAGLI